MPSFDTIKKLARCWSEPRLRAAAEFWPNPLTWAWFLGERCRELSRAECIERLSVAVAWLKVEKVALFVPVREIWLARNADKFVLLAAMAELGVFMDMWEAGEREPLDLPAVNKMLGIAPPANVAPQADEPVRIEGPALELERDAARDEDEDECPEHGCARSQCEDDHEDTQESS